MTTKKPMFLTFTINVPKDYSDIDTKTLAAAMTTLICSGNLNHRESLEIIHDMQSVISESKMNIVDISIQNEFGDDSSLIEYVRNEKKKEREEQKTKSIKKQNKQTENQTAEIIPFPVQRK